MRRAIIARWWMQCPPEQKSQMLADLAVSLMKSGQQ